MSEFLKPTSGKRVATYLSGEKRHPTKQDVITDITEAELLERIKTLNLPLNPETIDSIVGYGGLSVAFRMISPDNKNYICVLGGLNPDTLQDDVDRSDQILENLGDQGVRHDRAIVEGWDNKPMLLRISEEVQGDTLSGINPIYLFGNEKALESYQELSEKVLKYFLENSRIPDLIGKKGSSKFNSFLLQFFPITSGNIVLDENTNKLMFIDEDHSIPLAGGTRRQKTLALINAGSTLAWLEASRLALSGHKLSKRLNRQTETADPEQQYNFYEGLKNAIETLDGTGIKYSVMGSVAHAAAMSTFGDDINLSPRRSNGAIRDLDIKLLEQIDLVELESLKRYFDNLTNSIDGFPEVSIHPTELRSNQSLPKHKRLSARIPVLFTHTVFEEDGRISLAYKDLTADVTDELMDIETHYYKDIPIKTYNPATLAGLYLTRGGMFKFKDINKVYELLNISESTIPTKFSDFAKAIRSEYPEDYKNFLIIEFFYYFSGGRLSPYEIKRRLNNLRAT